MKPKRNATIARQVKQRDGRCVGCGREDGLDAHHTQSWGSIRTDNPETIVTLCRVCHAKWHNGDEVIRTRVQEHLEQVNQPGWITRTTRIPWHNLI